jgi:hypothetical protein
LINAILISVCLALAFVFSGRSKAAQQIVAPDRVSQLD